jgi:hypothetical protein
MWVERYRYFFQNQDACKDDVIRAAQGISIQPWMRGQIEAYIMAEATVAEICDRWHVFPETIEAYQKIFCDLEPILGKEGNLMKACLENGVSKDLTRLRLFGLRYGKIFLDWVLSRVTVLSEGDFEYVELRLRSILLMRAVEIDQVRLKDKERFDTLMKVVSTLSRYKGVVRAKDAKDELGSVLTQLKGLVENVSPPVGLPKGVLEAELALPARGGNGSRGGKN